MQSDLNSSAVASVASQRIYEAIRDVAVRQRDAIGRSDFGAFHRLLAEREALVSEAARAGEGQRAAAADVLREIMTLDEENQRLLSAQIDDARRELQATRSGQHAFRAYGAPAQRDTHLIDHRG